MRLLTVNETLPEHRYRAYPGGPEVLETMRRAVSLSRAALQVTWNSLAKIGDLSSASSLHVLSAILTTRPPWPGSYGLMLATGPGFCAELVLPRIGES